MARARNIKPGFFANEELVELEFSTRLLFIGLWTIADREGRLEDKPKRIKMALFPADNLDVDEALDGLQKHGFIQRYEVDGGQYIQILAFSKHQNPHRDEKQSTIPAPCEHRASTVQTQDKHSSNRADSLIPDPLNSDSLIPESPNPDPLPASPVAPPEEPAAPRKKKEPDSAETWKAYTEAYFLRHGTEPVRNQTTNALMANFVKRIGMKESPHVARFYVAHNAAYYVRQMHSLQAMLADAEKLRTEWATNTQMTNTKAQQADRTQTNYQAFSALIAEAEEQEG
jgi:hypothetical protein